MQKNAKRIVCVVIALILVLLLCVVIVKTQRTNKAAPTSTESTTTELTSTVSIDDYEAFCKKQKQRLDAYLAENKSLSLTDFAYGSSESGAINLAAVCYDTDKKSELNIRIFTDDGVGALTLAADMKDVVYLNEYPIYVYSNHDVEVPAFQGNKNKMIFYQLECTHDENGIHYKSVAADKSVREELNH